MCICFKSLMRFKFWEFEVLWTRSVTWTRNIGKIGDHYKISFNLVAMKDFIGKHLHLLCGSCILEKFNMVPLLDDLFNIKGVQIFIYFSNKRQKFFSFENF